MLSPALVPAEVLTAHAAIVALTTKTDATTTSSPAQVTITEPGTLYGTFWALIAVSMLLYAVTRVIASKWDIWDWIRVLILPLAFVGWTMLQRVTAFDAVASDLNPAVRSATAIVGAVILGLVVAELAYKADQKPAPAG